MRKIGTLVMSGTEKDKDEDEDEDEDEEAEASLSSVSIRSKPSGILSWNFCVTDAAALAAMSSKLGSHGDSQTLQRHADGGLRKLHLLHCHFLYSFTTRRNDEETLNEKDEDEDADEEAADNVEDDESS